MMFRCGRGTLSRPTCSLVLVFALVAILSSGFEINETQEVASLMDQLFYEGDTCNTPALELGFAVEASQDGTPEDRETAFTNAMEFVKTMARAMNVSDSGTHVGLIVYGKKPSMPFDFNEYFDMPSLSDAIDQVKQPKDGHMTGHALSYVKKQLYDKSARPGIPKALIVVLSKKSGDLVVQGAQALKSSGVKIYTVGIGPESDPLEMNDLASDIKDTFVTDDAHLPSLVKKLVPKICSESKDTSPAEELEMTSDGEHESTMSPDQEPGPQESRPLTAVTHLPTEPVGMVKPASKTAPVQHRPIQALFTKEQIHTTSDGDMNTTNDTASSHTDLFGTLSEARDTANEASGIQTDRFVTSTNKEESSEARGNTLPPRDRNDAPHTVSKKPAGSSFLDARKKLRNLAKKVCLAKADIGILIDGSSTVGKTKFASLVKFTKSLVESFSVSRNHTHIAVATAARGPHMSFDLKGFNDEISLDTAISRMTFFGGPFLLGSSLTGVKTSWFKNSGRKTIPQLLLVLATAKSADDIVAPSRMMRDRGVRIESVGIGPGFDGAQLKEIATHPAQDHVMAVSKFELLPMIRPLLTFRMCRAVGGKLVPRPTSGVNKIEDSATVDSEASASFPISNKQKSVDSKPHRLRKIKLVKQDSGVKVQDKKPVKQDSEVQKNKLETQLKQLDQIKQMQQENKTDSGSAQQGDELQNEKIKKDIRRKLYELLRKLGGSRKDIKAAYRSIISNINGHFNSDYCKDSHSMCEQWAKNNLCERGSDAIDSQSVQRVCPKSCEVCFR